MNALQNRIIPNVIYADLDLWQCVGRIMLDYGFDDWTLQFDKRIPAYKMQAFNPQYITVQQALEELAEAYYSVLEVNEQSRTVRLTRKVASGGQSDVYYS